MNSDTDIEVVNVVKMIVDLLKVEPSISLSNLSTRIKMNTSKAPIWKRTKISLSEFIKKFPENFLIDSKTLSLTLITEDVDAEKIIRSWNTHKTDQEVLNEKFGTVLKPFQLPQVQKLVSKEDDVCNRWIIDHIYDLNANIIGFDTETAPDTPVRPSIIQLSTGPHNLIVQLKNMDTLPEQLLRVLQDENIIKLGVGIVSDMKDILKSLDEVLSIPSVLDLSSLHDTSSQSLRHIAASTLGVFLDNKGSSDVKISDWSQDQLSEEQIEYAITDAYIAVEIFRSMNPQDFKQKLSTVVPVKKKLKVKKSNKEQEEAKKKVEIERKIKKWLKDDDSPELVFEPMNSYFRNYIHGLGKKNDLVSKTDGEEPSKYVVLTKC